MAPGRCGHGSKNTLVTDPSAPDNGDTRKHELERKKAQLREETQDAKDTRWAKRIVFVLLVLLFVTAVAGTTPLFTWTPGLHIAIAMLSSVFSYFLGFSQRPNPGS